MRNIRRSGRQAVREVKDGQIIKADSNSALQLSEESVTSLVPQRILVVVMLRRLQRCKTEKQGQQGGGMRQLA